MVLCFVVTYSMVGFAFGLVGLAFGWNTRNQGRLLSLIEMPVQLVTSYVCFRFLAKELAAKAVERALDDKQKLEQETKAAAQLASGKPVDVTPVRADDSGET
jgi:hypothetical protein